MPLHVSSTCAHHQEVKIALHSLWYRHTETCEWSKITKIQFYKYEQIVVKFICEFFRCDYCVLLTINMLCHVKVMFIQLLNLLERYYGVRDGTVVKVLCYKLEGRWFDPSGSHWNFLLTKNPSDCTMALGSIQPLTEMSTRSISWR